MTHNKKRQETLRSCSGDCEPHRKKEAGDFQELCRKVVISKDESEERSRRKPKHNMIHGKGKGKEIMQDEDEKQDKTLARSESWPHKGTLELEIPFHPPPASPAKMRLLKMPKPFGMQREKFDPKTYVEKEATTKDSSSRRPIHSKNVVRWREVKNPDGTVTCESNARFVRWSDGSLQLIIGAEAPDVREDEVPGIQQLCLRHGRAILQCQGRLLQKLIVTPTSMPSRSHPSSTRSIHIPQKKVPKVKAAPQSLIQLGRTTKTEKQKRKKRLAKRSN